MKKSICVVGIMCVLQMVSFAQNSNSQATLDKIAAIIDKEIITHTDLNFSIQQYALQNHLDPKSTELRDRVLDGMINDKLILAQALEDSIIVTDEEVTDRLERQIQMLQAQAGSREKLEEVYGMSVSRMKRDYQFRELIRKQMLVQKIQQTRQAGVTISRREVEEFFEQYKDSIPKVPTEYELSHIFIQPKPDSSIVESVYKKSLAILDSLKAGGDFADFAKRYSVDPGSAQQGGDLGLVRRGNFVKEFEEAVFALKEKEFSKPVKSQYGYHVIQLIDRKGESVHPRHILLPIEQSQANDDSTIALLQRIRARALAGESFAVLTKRFSEDPDTKDIGGDLGKVAFDQLDQSYEATVKAMKAGEISEPKQLAVGNKHGYHIIFVRSITHEHTINLNDDSRRLEQLALQFKSANNYQKWIDELRKNIYWEKKM